MYTQSYFVTRSLPIVARENATIISLFIVISVNVAVENIQVFTDAM